MNDPSSRLSPGDPAVKICGLMRPEDALAADRAGARYVGVILAEGFGRTLSLDRAREVLAGVERARPVTVRVDDDPGRVVEEARALSAAVIQLHGEESPDTAAEIRNRSGVQVWKAVRVRSVADVIRAVADYLQAVDALLLDGWHPDRVGGTGTRFSWEEVGRVRGEIPGELGLVAAGGLDPENVRRAVEVLRPGVVDVSSGVESEVGRKDPELIDAFVRAATTRTD